MNRCTSSSPPRVIRMVRCAAGCFEPSRHADRREERMTQQHVSRWAVPLSAALFMVTMAFGVRGQAPSGSYTREQVETGKAIYGNRCAECHAADLQGTGHGPALAGPA